MGDLGKLLIISGFLIVLLGVIFVAAGRMHLPLGRLPGDFTIRGKGFTFYFPLATSIILSMLLSLLFWFLGRR